MEYLTHCYEFVYWLQWRDLLEISCFFIGIYSLLSWLAENTKPKLIIWIYGWAGLLGSAYLLELNSLYGVMVALIPLGATLCLIMHQDVVQRTLLVPKRIIPSPSARSDDWFEIMLRACLHIVHTQGSVTCVIERNDSVSSMISTLAPFNVPLTDSLMRKALILHEPNSYLWIRESGYLVAVDATWLRLENEKMQQETPLFEWQQHALLLTHKSDAIIWHVQGAEKIVTIVAQGSIIENITFGTAIKILRHSLFQSISTKDTHGKAVNAVSV